MLLLQRGAILALAFLVQSGFAHADETAESRQAAIALLDQLHPADTVASLMPSVIAQLRTNLTHNDPDLIKQFDGIAPKLLAEGEAAKDELVEKIVDIYAQTFTADELRAMSAFYQTPVGRKMIATQIQLNGEMIAAARDWGTKVAQKIAKEAQAELQGPRP